jgi:glycosyltransferase involved in cell wall biosynthesis
VLAPRNGGNEETVSVIVAVRNGGSAPSRLLDSLLRQTHAAVETIIVAPGGEAKLSASSAVSSVIDTGPAPFHRARANNLGAAAANGDHLLFLAEDCELSGPEAIAQLLLHAALPRVAAVGPLAVRPDGRVEQAGFAIGLAEVAAPMAPDATADGDGYYGSLPCSHEVSALSAECMLVRRSEFEAEGGFNEVYRGQFEDYDLCQRLARRGLAAVYAARARVVSHRLPAVRRADVDIVDRALFVDCWYDELLRGDPYFNPGFARERADYSPAGWRERVFHAINSGGRR